MPAPAEGDHWRDDAASLGVDPNTLCHPSALLLAAHRLTLSGQRKAAEGAYRELLRLLPTHRPGLVNLLTLLRVQGRHGEAGAVQKRLIAVEVDELGLPPDERDRLLEFRLGSASLGAGPERAPAAHIARSFDEYADDYDGHLRDQLGYRAPEVTCQAVSRVLGPQEASLDVLDLGCGTGLAAPLLRPWARTLDGVDLSPGMLEKARAGGLYDRLEVGDLTDAPRARPEGYDLAVAVDVLNYLGDLSPVMAAVAIALRPGGLFALTVEGGDGDGYALCASGRYAHSLAYVQGRAAAAGFEEVSAEVADLRTEQGRPVQGRVVVLRKSGPTPAA